MVLILHFLLPTLLALGYAFVLTENKNEKMNKNTKEKIEQ